MLKPLRRKPIQRERAEQIALFSWAAVSERRYPELMLMYAVPNGGKRHAIEARNLKRAGVRAGIPDVCLPVAKHGYSALYIEMKSADGKPTATQAEMMELLREYGNKVIICRRWEEAKHTIEWYLRGDVFKVQELSYTEL